jgi:NAD(P)H dehydrogenase (quinone)
LTRSVAIVGSNGKTGRAVAAALMEAGVEVRGLTRANANLHTGEGLTAAFADCSAVYHLAPNLHPLEVLIAANVIAAAKHSGVERIVFHSVLQPQISAMPHHVAKSRAEELVINSGLDWAILQPSAYAQNLSESVVGALPYRGSSLMKSRPLAPSRHVVRLLQSRRCLPRLAGSVRKLDWSIGAKAMGRCLSTNSMR